MPGLGWILKRSLYKEELEPRWPTPEKVSLLDLKLNNYFVTDSDFRFPWKMLIHLKKFNIVLICIYFLILINLLLVIVINC